MRWHRVKVVETELFKSKMSSSNSVQIAAPCLSRVCVREVLLRFLRQFRSWSRGSNLSSAAVCTATLAGCEMVRKAPRELLPGGTARKGFGKGHGWGARTQAARKSFCNWESALTWPELLISGIPQIIFV